MSEAAKWLAFDRRWRLSERFVNFWFRNLALAWYSAGWDDSVLEAEDN